MGSEVDHESRLKMMAPLARAYARSVPEHPADAVSKRLFRRQQAQDQERLARKIEKIAGVREDAGLRHEIDHQFLF